MLFFPLTRLEETAREAEHTASRGFVCCRKLSEAMGDSSDCRQHFLTSHLCVYSCTHALWLEWAPKVANLNHSSNQALSFRADTSRVITYLYLQVPIRFNLVYHCPAQPNYDAR